MSKVDIDYSNTIFYKISCKDTNITDLYIGHTINFVQRKCAHKQSCINPKYANYNCKVYKIIRQNGGWDNWRMDIIAYHECKDLHEARTKEQEYFILYNATLNSIEPMPGPKCVNTPSLSLQINTNDVKSTHLCDICHFSCFNTQNAYNLHLTRNRHIKAVNRLTKLSANVGDKLQKLGKEYKCEKCDFITHKKTDYNRHITTRKHITNNTINVENDEMRQKTYMCGTCDKTFMDRSGLWRHRKKCCENTQPEPPAQVDMSAVIELLKYNQDLKELIKQTKHMVELQQTLISHIH
jgi:hypothetical protein